MKSKKLASCLRKRVVIEEPIRVSDEAGGFTESWQEVVSAFAEILPVTGREKLSAFKMQGEISHKATIRYVSGITTGMRLKLGARLLNIRAVINSSEMNERLILLCDEGAGV